MAENNSLSCFHFDQLQKTVFKAKIKQQKHNIPWGTEFKERHSGKFLQPRQIKWTTLFIAAFPFLIILHLIRVVNSTSESCKTAWAIPAPSQNIPHLRLGKNIMVSPIAHKITELWESHSLLCYGKEINEFKVTEFNFALSHTQARIHTHSNWSRL